VSKYVQHVIKQMEDYLLTTNHTREMYNDLEALGYTRPRLHTSSVAAKTTCILLFKTQRILYTVPFFVIYMYEFVIRSHISR
jgi:hypothetical protein